MEALTSDLSAHLTVTEMLGQLADGSVTSEALTELYLRRIDAIDGLARAFFPVDCERALRQARHADSERAAGRRAPLLGVPFAIKDIIETEDQITTYGSAAFADHRPASDARIVKLLRSAGAVILGKTNTLEFAYLSLSPLGPSKNPWDPTRFAGGSSNGSATAVSLGLSAAAIGTDSAGSVRIPSSYCGIVGLKPTFGAVSTCGVSCLSSSMDTVGPMARSVADVALIHSVLAGSDPSDASSLDAPEPFDLAAWNKPITGMRIGIPTNLPVGLVSPEVGRHWSHMAQRLGDAGAIIERITLPSIDDVHALWVAVSAPEFLSWHQDRDGYPGILERYGSANRAALHEAVKVSAADYVRARRRKAHFRRSVMDSMAGVDVLLLPTTPTTAPPLSELVSGAILSGDARLDVVTATTGLTMPFNLTGQPSLSVPAGVDSNGLPVGLQIVGRHFSEAMLLRVGAAIEAMAAFASIPPRLEMPNSQHG